MRKKLLIAAALLVAIAIAVAAFLFFWKGPVPSVAPITPVTETLDISSETVENWDRVIAYVPLDDRTDNMEDVVYLAEASGYRVVMPDGDIYCTKLDGQSLNSNGTQYGDREALMTWVREMDQKGCNLFLMSLDQLFSGGLVNSRWMSQGQDLVFDDGTTLSETDAFDEYILTLADDPANRIYLFDSVVRLASTVAYEGFGIEEYYALREYGMVARPTLEGDALTLENVFANYPYAADGITPAEDAMADNTYRKVLTDQMLENYLSARVRKLTLLDHVISALKETKHKNIQLLIGIDDSSNTTNIQYNELHYIERQLGEGSTLLTGLDSLARLLVGQIAQETYDYQVRASVRYIGGSQAIPSSEFDRYTLEEVVNLHMDLFRAERVSEQDAELQIVVMTAPSVSSKAAEYQDELINLLKYNQENHIPTVFIEASNNAYGDALENALLSQVDFGHLMAFAGKYDQANVTGAGFAMGFSRYLYLRCSEEKTDAADISHVQQIANSMALTYPYILHGRYPLNLYIQKLGYDYNNILATKDDMARIQNKLETIFLPGCESIGKNLTGTTVISDLINFTEKNIGAVTFSDVYMPWTRTFEISFTIHVDPLLPAA